MQTLLPLPCFLAMIALIRTFHDSYCLTMEFFPFLIPTQCLNCQEVLKFDAKVAITYDEVCFTLCLQRFVQYLTLESLQNKMLDFVSKILTYSPPAFFFAVCLLLFEGFFD